MFRGDLLETESPVCSRRFSHDLVTRPSFMRDGKLFVYILYLLRVLGRCVISPGTRASSASCRASPAGPGTRGLPTTGESSEGLNLYPIIL